MVMLDQNLGHKHFALHERLKVKLDNIKKIQEKEWDAIFLVDGIEGSGKSTLAITCAWYLSNGKLSINNICSGANEAVDKLKNLPEGSVMVIDEGSLMFSSNETMKREQRTLIKILNVIRQKRMCLIIVAPSFFRLNRYISVDRSRFLLHVYTTNDLARGKFIYFGQKKKNLLFQLGKKNFDSYKKPKSEWNGKFESFNPFGEEYAKVKERSLMEALQPEKKEKSIATIGRLVKIEIIKRNVEKLPVYLKTKGDLAEFHGIDRARISEFIKN